MNYIIISNDELYHHGVVGMHWGVRRYQNKDGSLTSAGRKRYTDYKPAIKEYRDSYDKASSMNDAADAKWRDVQAARKELGRTAIGRAIASARNKTEAAKKYNRMYDEWSKMQDDADEQWRDADEKYKHTGGNRLTRIANNIRYDTKLGSAKSGEKKQLTDEEKAARNKKIAKTVAVVAGTAVVAAGAYAAHKYLKNTMSEADSIMNDEKKKQMDRWMESFLKQEEVSWNASKRYEKAVNDYYGPRSALWDEKNERKNVESARKFAESARLDTATLRNRMKTADRTMSSNIGNKKVRRAAQREIIKRDIKNATLSAEIRRRKARNNPMDRVSQDWARAMISKPADSKIRSLAIRGESGLKKRR